MPSDNYFLTRQDVMVIPEKLLPMPVLSDNLKGFFGFAIKQHIEGIYNHFMWLYKPGLLATQNTLFTLDSVGDYFDKYRLKFWRTPWSDAERAAVSDAIAKELALPWYKRMYDYVGILGQVFWHDFQVPGFEICSDKGKFIRLADPTYDLKHPDPAQVDTWLREHEKYCVYGRYVPD